MTYLAIAACAAAIFAFTASRLKLAPFCIGGNSIAVMASFSTSCWTNTKRQNSYLNQSKYCLRAVLGPVIGPARALERIEAKVGDVGHVRLGLVAQPAARLVDETEFVVIDAHGTELAFAEVPDFVPIGRTLAGDHVHLVVAVQMALVGAVADLLTLLQLFGDVRVAGGGHEASGTSRARR